MSYSENSAVCSDQPSVRPRMGSRIAVRLSLIAASLREHSVLIAIGLTHCFIAQMLPHWLGLSRDITISIFDWVVFLLTRFAPAAAIGILVYWVMLRRRYSRRETPREMWRAGRRLAGFESLASTLPVLLMLIPVMSSFGFLKVAIPEIKPFSFDLDLAAFDRALHFGYDPWQLLQPILGHPLITYMFSSVYVTWYTVLYGMILWVAFWRKDRELRMQFLLTNVLLWPLMGNLAAIYFSSGGPVYFSLVTGLANPFLPLFDYLRQADLVLPIQALDIQDVVWQRHLGVSAMPSMHVASSFCFFLLGRRVGRKVGWALGAYCALIMLGSVHLGWHYAVDGYAGILGALALWCFSGWVLRRKSVRRLLWREDGRDAGEIAARGV